MSTNRVLVVPMIIATAATGWYALKRGHSAPVKPPTVLFMCPHGCDLSGLPEGQGKLVRWDDVPPFGADAARADEEIRRPVIELVEELVRSGPKNSDRGGAALVAVNVGSIQSKGSWSRPNGSAS